jgi:hypothetical protein
MKNRSTNKQEQQLWQYIEKHFQEWDIERFKTLIKSISFKENEKGAT